MRVVFATCAALPDGVPDDHGAAALLEARFAAWDDSTVDWDAHDRVLIRSVWDYTRRAGEFVAWCERVGARRLRNRPALVAWNADKRYLGDLACPTVPTVFAPPGDPLPAIDGEFVVKPNVSAGARSTGRFTRESAADAAALVESIHASGRVALVQPYMRSVDAAGETGIVFLAGEISHELHKRQILAPDQVAPLTEGPLRVATVMLSEDLVVARAAAEDERALARSIIAEISRRFGVPLYARVDMVRDEAGRPLLLELELIEPALYLATAAGAAERLAAAVAAG